MMILDILFFNWVCDSLCVFFVQVDHTFLKSVEVFDDVTKKWYRLADLNFPRAELRLLRSVLVYKGLMSKQGFKEL